MRGDLERSGLDPRFQLDGFVARGAWGSLYSGKDLETGAAVAVKRLHPHLCEPTMMARFEHEARLLAGLDSPHVVRHVAHGRDAEERPYLVLEWLDGEDLARWRKARRPAPRRIAEVVRQAALGLAVLHDSGIVHGDVKPSNFFLVETPKGPFVKLIDLGIARASGERPLTATGFTLGTPAYLSPEQARGDRSPAASSDLFSLGVVLFELLSGVKPYRGGDMSALAMKIVLQDPPRLRDALPDAPPAVDEVVARAMGKAPGDRFPSALALAEALAELELSDEAPEEPPESSEKTRSRVVRGGGGPGSGIPSSWIRCPSSEQRVITALFARFDGTPEPAPAIEGFREAAERHGGVFHHALGPQRAAVFGVAMAPGDAAHRAARAALAVAVIPGVRLAIVTGLPVAGEGCLSGGLIDRGLAEVRKSHGDVRVDETTARFLEGRFAVEGSKGERALAVAALPHDAEGPRLLGQPAPLHGREREVTALLALFAECAAERVARVILVTGPPGIGKSRLLYELTRRAHQASATPPRVLRGHGEAMGAGVAFGMIGPALRELAGEREAWHAWLAAECDRHPVVLVLEDLHWGDLPSVAFVDEALRDAKARPLLVVAAARPEVHERFPGLFAGRDLEERRLGPLTRKAAEKLVRKALGPEADDGVVHRLVERAAGNALQLEQLVCGVVAGGDGARLRDG